ncbi:hypothetical protein JHK86_016545 [Glycine max]|nr:hypothetical protein JHK86_016545 [Glycine max]
MLLIWFLLISYTTTTSTSTLRSVNHLAVSQSIRDGETLVSAGGITELGFFSPGNSTRRYLAIWYTNVSPYTVVWVANRNTPLQNNSGVLKLNEKGILELLSPTNGTIWSSNISSKAVNNPVAYLLDSGNFVVKNGHETNENSFLWQSFDYPTDTLMSGMKLGWNIETGLERYLTSWKSVEDPAEGEYTSKIELTGYPQLVRFKGPDIRTRIGSWNGLYLVGYPGPIHETSQKFVINEKEVYYEYDVVARWAFSVYKLTPSGTGQSLYWSSERTTRKIASTGEEDQCENYAFCGANSICNFDGNRPTCECLRGYVPKSPDQWNMSVWSDGCVPRNKSNCKNSYTDGFFTYKHLKLPDTSASRYNKTMNLDECQRSCLTTCSCTAYTNLDIRDGGSGCLLWSNDLVDMRKFSDWGQDLFVRVPASELADDFFQGKLIDGQVLAVKRLSKESGQGLEEFKNEVALIAKLQHHETKRKLLDWHKRFNIISGIARGLLYLHQDSRLRIIHRDLKTSNILLDANFDPKISDFGLARSFLGDQFDAKTNRVAGTYGYIPPEYAARGHFSVKSDVFSYGVILLEIVSGKKNREFSDPQHYNNLLGHAWRLWTEGRALELLDEVLGEQCTLSEIIRCIQIGLLCVQQRPEDRPDMSSVGLFLNGDKLLSKPKVPGFYTEKDVTSEANSSSANHKLCSVNELSITILDAR